MDRRPPLLIELIQRRAALLGLTIKEACEQHLGCVPNYYFQLKSGKRSVSSVSGQFAANCAQFLGMPRIVVLLIAGVLTPVDWELHAEQMRPGAVPLPPDLDALLAAVAVERVDSASPPAKRLPRGRRSGTLSARS